MIIKNRLEGMSFWVIWLIIPLGLFAKTPEQPLTLYDMEARFHEGRSILLLDFKANIPSPWHVYADSLDVQYLIPSQLYLLDSTSGKLMQKKFPTPREKNLLGEIVPVFVGINEFQGKFYLNPPVQFPQEIVFFYQACDDKMCLPPEKKIMTIEKNGENLMVRLQP